MMTTETVAECVKCGKHNRLVRVGKLLLQPVHQCVDAAKGEYAPLKSTAWIALRLGHAKEYQSR